MYSHLCLCMTTLTEGFLCFFLSYKANARVKPAKTGQGPYSSYFLCCSTYFLCCSMSFCVVLCIVHFVSFSVLFVLLYMCTELLPRGGYSIAVKYIISYHILHHIISYIISYHIYHINHIILHHILYLTTPYYIISYMISYHISYHIVSYHIIKLNLV
jgi:hypothetical protein